ncbi:MAG: hypothetical protein HY925_15070, partial [Elusimicrobia bacterium]|nr:hypothetical protein [Elusimicrobiota bacterium]
MALALAVLLTSFPPQAWSAVGAVVAAVERPVSSAAELDSALSELKGQTVGLGARPSDVDSVRLAPLNARLARVQEAYTRLQGGLADARRQSLGTMLSSVRTQLGAYSRIDACAPKGASGDVAGRSGCLMAATRELVGSEAVQPTEAAWLPLLRARTELLAAQAPAIPEVKSRLERLGLIASTLEAARGDASQY